MSKSRIAVLSILLIALLLPVAVFADRYDIGDNINVAIIDGGIETRVEVKAPGNRAVTLRVEALIMLEATCANRDGAVEGSHTSRLQIQAAREQPVANSLFHASFEIIMQDTYQCPNDNWTVVWHISNIEQAISLLDTATREVLATKQCQATFDGATSVPCVISG